MIRSMLNVLYLIPLLLAVHAPAAGLEQNTVQIKYSDPLVPEQELRKRYQPYFNAGYDVSKEEFRLYIPDSYSSGVPHGVFVWVSPHENGTIPSQFEEVLEQRRLLGISAKKSGNDRAFNERILMAVDGARYMKRTYTVDEDRVYVSGMSGGSKVASKVTFIYPDVIDGTAYVGGVLFYKDVHLQGRSMVSGIFPDIPRKRLARVRQNRHAYMVGAKDGWQDTMKGAYEHVKSAGWKYVAYFEQKGLGHSPVNTSHFRKGITSLDQPLQDRATKRWKAMVNQQGSAVQNGDRNVLEQWRMLRDVWLHGFDADFAGEARTRMKNLQSRANKRAIQKLQKTLNQGNNSSVSDSTTTKLRKFYRRWKGLQAREKVHAELKKIAQQEIVRFKNQQNMSSQDIRSFYNKWVSLDVDVIEQVMKLYDQAAMKASREFASGELSIDQVGQLKQFRRRWDGSEAARKALQEIDRLLSGAVERIKKQPATKQTTNKLIQIALRFPATGAGKKALNMLKKRDQYGRFNHIKYGRRRGQ